MDMTICNSLLEREKRLHDHMRSFILETLKQHGGRIALMAEEEIGEHEDSDFPVTLTCYGENGNPNIMLVFVSLEDDCLYLYGVETFGSELHCHDVYPEHYHLIMEFMAEVIKNGNNNLKTK